MRSFIAATLLTAVAAETYTAWTTDVHSVISCGPEVTDCPGSSTSAPVYKPTTSSTSTTCTDEEKTSATWTKPTSAPWTSTWTTAEHKTSTVHITTSTSVTESKTVPTKPATWAKSSGAPYPSGSCSPGHPGYPGYTGGSSGLLTKTYAPTGTGSWSKPTPSGPATYKGAASSVHAAGFLAGAGALFAFLL